MKIACVQSTAVNLFDEFCLTIPPKLKSYQDGPPGQRVMFITDQKENFNISFEEGMKLLDMISEGEGVSTVSYQCRQNGKYIHLQRRSQKPIPCAFFHIELNDADGTTHVLPGQMVIYTDYTWSDDVEPVLMELLSGITVCNMKNIHTSPGRSAAGASGLQTAEQNIRKEKMDYE